MHQITKCFTPDPNKIALNQPAGPESHNTAKKTPGISKNTANNIQHILNRPNSSRDLQISTNKHRILQKTPQINYKSYGITQNTIKIIQNHRRRTKNIPNPTKPTENIHFLMFFDILCRLLLFCDVSKLWPARNPRWIVGNPFWVEGNPLWIKGNLFARSGETSVDQSKPPLSHGKPLWAGGNLFENPIYWKLQKALFFMFFLFFLVVFGGNLVFPVRFFGFRTGFDRNCSLPSGFSHKL